MRNGRRCGTRSGCAARRSRGARSASAGTGNDSTTSSSVYALGGEVGHRRPGSGTGRWAAAPARAAAAGGRCRRRPAISTAARSGGREAGDRAAVQGDRAGGERGRPATPGDGAAQARAARSTRCAARGARRPAAPASTLLEPMTGTLAATSAAACAGVQAGQLVPPVHDGRQPAAGGVDQHGHPCGGQRDRRIRAVVVLRSHQAAPSRSVPAIAASLRISSGC